MKSLWLVPWPKTAGMLAKVFMALPDLPFVIVTYWDETRVEWIVP